MTNQAWSRLKPAQKAGLIVAALVLPCCGGAAVIGALAADGDTSGKAPTGQAQRLADAEPATTTATAATTATAPATASAGASADIEKRIVTVTKPIAFKTRTVKDNQLPDGEKEQRTSGVNGVRTLTYTVTLVDGRETARKLVSSEVTRKPVTRVIAVGTYVEPDDDDGGECTPGYEPCVPVASDVDCAGGSGNGPAYVDGPIRVTGSDPYDLDRDGDGIACDS